MTLHSIVSRNGVQSPQTLFPRAGDVVHPVLRNRGLVYQTRMVIIGEKYLRIEISRLIMISIHVYPRAHPTNSYDLASQETRCFVVCNRRHLE